FEPNTEQQPLGAAVPGTEGEVPDTVEDGAAAMDFEGLNDMRVVTDDHIGPALHCHTSSGPIPFSGLAFVRDAPVESDHDPVHSVPQGLDIALQRLPGADRDAGSIG